MQLLKEERDSEKDTMIQSGGKEIDANVIAVYDDCEPPC